MLCFDDGEYRVHRLPLGVIRTNAFVVETPKGAFVIDPGAEAPKLLAYLETNGITPDFGLATHCHFDHVGAAEALFKAGKLPVLYHHEEDRGELEKLNTYSLLLARTKTEMPTNARPIDGAFTERLLSYGFRWMPAPGHTAGGIVVHERSGKFLFSGDTILNNTISLDGLPFFEKKDVLAGSLRKIREAFPGGTLVFPGHGKLTLLGVEMEYNRKIRALIG